ncbi:helix-turn-helix domain-containing protein [Mogibacterium sp.]|uniref:helix-turn-helix domain-containing protein n=1 Tax=Mogibacterium sp. TaxID=2049035 RepID=UPI003FA568E0
MFVKVSEFAKIMGVSTVSVYRLIESDSIPYYKIGKSIRLNIDDFRKGKESGYEELQIED